jgi:hypothetical protein
MPTVDAKTGAVTNGPIEAGGEFGWTCNGHGLPNGTSITVHAGLMPGGNGWFESSSGVGSITFSTPNTSANVTAEAESPIAGWTWTATGVQVDAGAHVIVEPSFPKHAQKAS